ncbi:hypothetical protein ACLS0M_08950, partial [Avibacterium avium]
MNEIIYTREELADKSDEELLAILANSWGIEDNKFEIYAELPPQKEAAFGFLRNARLLKTGERLYYPLYGEADRPCNFYIGPKDISIIGSKKEMKFIRCQLDISPREERIKHENPFELNVKPGTAELLSKLPESYSYDIISHSSSKGDIQILISSSIYNFYFKQAKEIIDKE